MHPSPFPWPTRSPGLTVCDFFLWGFMKSQIFNRPDPPDTVEQLKLMICDVADERRPRPQTASCSNGGMCCKER
ncbi:unnamed protein product [Bursaphelenchus xylophilus]|uniref:(pine wood nematode) hypothetical protein n=1 Tax=Bursaphelenchus xylophilus TaxID=6326 RepID=A0A1I7SVK4_BURXY|nr:unnamed protein product [Bursaphelenchus xylophilus]CAG9101590.1 unnamed protein product [Bursaphelenchus xylophilus]